MAKFFGVLGYGHSTEIVPGDWEDVITEKSYYGDVNQNTRRLVENQKVNFDLTLTNTISVMADAYANENFNAIRYARWNGSLWVVTSVQVQRPRLILELGGVYNGPTP
jgi:hypothetical protein